MRRGSGDITTWGADRAFLKHFCRGVSHPTTQGGLSNDCFSESSQSTRISPRAKLQVVINWPRLMATSTFAGNGNRGSGSTLRRSTAVYARRTERRSASVIDPVEVAAAVAGVSVPEADVVVDAGREVVAGVSRDAGPGALEASVAAGVGKLEEGCVWGGCRGVGDGF